MLCVCAGSREGTSERMTQTLCGVKSLAPNGTHTLIKYYYGLLLHTRYNYKMVILCLY